MSVGLGDDDLRIVDVADASAQDGDFRDLATVVDLNVGHIDDGFDGGRNIVIDSDAGGGHRRHIFGIEDIVVVAESTPDHQALTIRAWGSERKCVSSGRPTDFCDVLQVEGDHRLSAGRKHAVAAPERSSQRRSARGKVEDRGAGRINVCGSFRAETAAKDERVVTGTGDIVCIASAAGYDLESSRAGGGDHIGATATVDFYVAAADSDSVVTLATRNNALHSCRHTAHLDDIVPSPAGEVDGNSAEP